MDSVAFDQEDLADLLDNDVHDIYLCNNSFVIPLRMEDKKYVGIGKAEAVIKSEEWVDFAAKKIVFDGVEFDAAYEKIYEESAEGLYQLGKKYYKIRIYDKAVECFRQSADKGNIDAMDYLGRCFYNGDGVEIDKEEAFYLQRQAALLGNASAMCAVSFCYRWGEGIEKSENQAQEWLQRAVDKRYAPAMLSLGRNYITGDTGYPKDIALGLQWLNKAVVAGEISAMIEMGDIYAGNTYYETSVRKDAQTALMWYKKALESCQMKANDDSAKDILGKLAKLYVDYGVGEVECAEALKWTEQMANSGDGSAMYDLGKYYEEGKGCEKDLDEALKWYKKALNNGYKWLTDSIGKIYDEQGDYPKAIEWYEKYIEDNKEVEDTLKDMRKERVIELKKLISANG